MSILGSIDRDLVLEDMFTRTFKTDVFVACFDAGLEKWKRKNTNVRIIAHSFKFQFEHFSRSYPWGTHCCAACLKGTAVGRCGQAPRPRPLPASPTRSVELQGSPWPDWQWDREGFAAWSPYGFFSLGQMRSVRGRLLAHPGSWGKEKTGGSCRVFVCRGEQGYYTYEVYIYTYI